MSWQQPGAPRRGPAPFGRGPFPGYPPPGPASWGGPPSYPGNGFRAPSGAPWPGGPQPGGPQLGGPPFGGPRRPAPRRRSPLAALLLTLIVLGGLAMAATALVGTTTAPSDTAYQNEDYRVPPPDRTPPPLPVPESYDEAEQIVARSTFYAQTAPDPVRCNAQPVNVASATDAELKSHFEAMMECLVRVWEPPVTAAGFEVVRPSVTIYGTKMTTKCGTSGVNAFYCAADQQVYFSNRLAEGVPIVRQDKWAADVVIAHEFGHALQARTAILISAKALGQDSGEEQTDLLYSRRLETQADCLSGVFMRSVSTSLGIQASDRDGIIDTYAAVGDDAVSGDARIVGNHGLSRSRVAWGTQGLDSSAVGVCNTFAAPQSQVR